ncbi:Gfo/Idh/MocA family oxidoreductase [Acidisoma cellulosilytica]|uniref:Gfo/Idh/MocA family oxidoreductase n=1 Tax=Acidisoma cellulosilyticum TaxID=2802395 RepID=A0A964E4C5_9PROT|nr:Gfo/Idh/MocA family oxidoreductase [Acidisoma cellulosilyticum]MCB8881326.1 Gfo/Idh/MocA family oxidoreductase [Acidisoma cellulosilyticum]
MQRLNVGMIGGGFMGKAHALAYAAMPMFFWPARAIPVRHTIADVSDELASDAAARLGFARGVADWRAVIDDPDIHIIDIVTPNNSHPEIAIAAAQAGKHVICEKPLARTAAEAKTMLDAVEAAGVTHMVAFNYRHTPAVALAQKIIAEGRIGTIRNFRGTYLQDWSADPNSPLSWRFQKKIAGSGAVGDIATHVIDMARYLVGEIAAVNALTRTYVTERPVQNSATDKLGAATRLSGVPTAPVDVDDEVMTLLRFENGAVGSLEATRNAFGRNNYLTFEIHGSTGSILFNYERRDELQVMFADDPADQRGFRTIYTGPAHPYGEGLWPIPALGIGYGETKIIECHLFISAIVEGRQPSPNFRDGYINEVVADAILHSAEQSGWVDITV